MTEVLEPASMAAMLAEFDAECPFNLPDEKTAQELDDESIKNDDEERALSRQANNGGTLGTNMTDASPGKKGTIEGPFPPDEADKTPAYDSKRPRANLTSGKPEFLWAEVPGAGNIPTAPYPVLVAAHHLIPGNASMKNSDVEKFMVKKSKVESVQGKKYEIKDHIGYNINGAHNGVWLPGNYAIRRSGGSWKRTPLKGKSWSGLGDHDWCLNYVAAACKATGGQFHDAHSDYSSNVRLKLNDIGLALANHLDNCEPCQKKANKKIPPPFKIKKRLYNLSAYFKNKLGGPPTNWKKPFFSSNPWSNKAFPGDKPSASFTEAYDAARAVHVLKPPPKAK